MHILGPLGMYNVHCTLILWQYRSQEEFIFFQSGSGHSVLLYLGIMTLGYKRCNKCLLCYISCMRYSRSHSQVNDMQIGRYTNATCTALSLLSEIYLDQGRWNVWGTLGLVPNIVGTLINPNLIKQRQYLQHITQPGLTTIIVSDPAV